MTKQFKKNQTTNLNQGLQFSGLLFALVISISTVEAAEEITFTHGIFGRTILVKHLEEFVKTEKTEKTLSSLIKATKKQPKEISEILTQEVELPIVVTSKLMNSKIGEVILARISKIIHPYKIPSKNISIPAIRAGVTKTLYVNEGKVSLINFLKNYPNKQITINVPALRKVINKVDSINDLVKFFSNSPLEKLREPNSLT